VINPRDPTAYLKHVLHRETLCDIHSNQIRGAWLRCCHCAAGFDICQEAEQIADHDATHGEWAWNGIPCEIGYGAVHAPHSIRNRDG
jgi:hypothetical protein